MILVATVVTSQTFGGGRAAPCGGACAPRLLLPVGFLTVGCCCSAHHQPLRGESACAGRGTALPAGKQVQTQLLSPLVTPLSHISPSLKLVSVGIKSSCLLFLDTFLKLKTHPPCQLLEPKTPHLRHLAARMSINSNHRLIDTKCSIFLGYLYLLCNL